MLTIREPLSLRTARLLSRLSPSFGEKIEANYEMAVNPVNGEELFHLTEEMPWILIQEGGQYQITSFHEEFQKHVTIQTVNQVLNRLMLWNEMNVTYQDQMYIERQLRRMGIREVSLFLRQVREGFREERERYRLTETYENLGSIFREASVSLEKLWAKQGAVSDGEEKVPSTRALSREIYSRLDTRKIYKEVCGIWRNQIADGLASSYMDETLRFAEYERAGLQLALSKAQEEALGLQQGITEWMNPYERVQRSGYGAKSVEQIKSQIISAVLLNLAEQVYVHRLDTPADLRREWTDVRSVFRGTAINTLERFEEYHRGNRILTEREIAFQEEMLKLYREENSFLTILENLWKKAKSGENQTGSVQEMLMKSLELILKQREGRWEERAVTLQEMPADPAGDLRTGDIGTQRPERGMDGKLPIALLRKEQEEGEQVDNRVLDLTYLKQGINTEVQTGMLGRERLESRELAKELQKYLGIRQTGEEAGRAGTGRSVEEAGRVGIGRSVEEAGRVGIGRSVEEAGKAGTGRFVEEADGSGFSITGSYLEEERRLGTGISVKETESAEIGRSLEEIRRAGIGRPLEGTRKAGIGGFLEETGRAGAGRFLAETGISETSRSTDRLLGESGRAEADWPLEETGRAETGRSEEELGGFGSARSMEETGKSGNTRFVEEAGKSENTRFVEEAGKLENTRSNGEAGESEIGSYTREAERLETVRLVERDGRYGTGWSLGETGISGTGRSSEEAGRSEVDKTADVRSLNAAGQSRAWDIGEIGRSGDIGLAKETGMPRDVMEAIAAWSKKQITESDSAHLNDQEKAEIENLTIKLIQESLNQEGDGFSEYPLELIFLKEKAFDSELFPDFWVSKEEIQRFLTNLAGGMFKENRQEKLSLERKVGEKLRKELSEELGAKLSEELKAKLEENLRGKSEGDQGRKPEGHQGRKPEGDQVGKPGRDRVGKLGGDRVGKLGGDQVGKLGRDQVGKPGRDQVGKPGGDQVGKPGGDQVGKPGGDQVGKPGGDQVGRPGRDQGGKPGRDQVGKQGGDQVEKPGRDQGGKTGRDQVGKQGGDQVGKQGGDQVGKSEGDQGEKPEGDLGRKPEGNKGGNQGRKPEGNEGERPEGNLRGDQRGKPGENPGRNQESSQGEMLDRGLERRHGEKPVEDAREQLTLQMASVIEQIGKLARLQEDRTEFYSSLHYDFVNSEENSRLAGEEHDFSSRGQLRQIIRGEDVLEAGSFQPVELNLLQDAAQMNISDPQFQSLQLQSSQLQSSQSRSSDTEMLQRHKERQEMTLGTSDAAVEKLENNYFSEVWTQVPLLEMELAREAMETVNIFPREIMQTDGIYGELKKYIDRTIEKATSNCRDTSEKQLIKAVEPIKTAVQALSIDGTLLTGAIPVTIRWMLTARNPSAGGELLAGQTRLTNQTLLDYVLFENKMTLEEKPVQASPILPFADKIREQTMSRYRDFAENQVIKSADSIKSELEMVLDRSETADIVDVSNQEETRGSDYKEIKKYLDQINEQNVLKYRELSENQLWKAIEPVKKEPDMKRIRAESRKALTDPAGMMEHFKQIRIYQEDGEEKASEDRQRLEVILRQADDTTRYIYNQIWNYNEGERSGKGSSTVKPMEPIQLVTDFRRIMDESKERMLLSNRTVDSQAGFSDKLAGNTADRYMTAASIVFRQPALPVTEDLLEKLARKQETHVREEIKSSVSESVVKQQNEIVKQTEIINRSSAGELKELIEKGIMRQMGTISEKVYHKLEKKMEREIARRGR